MGWGKRGVEDDVTRVNVNYQAQPLSCHDWVSAVVSEKNTTLLSFWHWLTELAEVYARHAGRHGSNWLLPAVQAFKAIRGSHSTANCTDGRKPVSITATSDDELVNASAAP